MRYRWLDGDATESVHGMEPTAIAGLTPPPVLLNHLHLSPVAPTLCHTLQALSHTLSCRFHCPKPAPLKNQMAWSPPSGSPGTSGFSLFGWVEQEADLSVPESGVLTQGPQGQDTEELANGLGRLCRQSGLWRSQRAQGPAWRGWLWGRLELQTIFRLLFDLRQGCSRLQAVVHWGKTEVAPTGHHNPTSSLRPSELPLLPPGTRVGGRKWTGSITINPICKHYLER